MEPVEPVQQDAPALGTPPALESRTRDFLAAHNCPGATAAPPGGDVTTTRARMTALWDTDDDQDADVEEEWLALPGRDGGRIRVRILRPVGSEEALPVVLYLHGLGWRLADARAHRQLLADLVLGADAAVVVPEYEAPDDACHPGAVERAHAVAAWIARHGAQCRLDGTRTAVVGISAGAQQAAALTLLTHESGGPHFRHQVLICPVTDAAMDTPSYEQFADGYLLSRTDMQHYWQQYAPDPATHTLATVSPLRAPDVRFRGLPPALVVTAEADVLRDEGEAYAARLRAADVPVVSVRYHGTIHGFVLFDHLRATAASRAARIQIMDTLHTALHVL